MSKGKRFENQPKINKKTILIAIFVLAIIVLFVKGISNLLKKENTDKNFFTETSYFTMYNNGKWGVINSHGETVIEAGEDEINSEMIVIPNSKKDVFICTYSVNYDDNTYKTKAVNAQKETLFSNYENVEALSNYKTDKKIWYENNCLKVQKDGKYGLIDLNGNEILSCIYDKIDTLKGVENSILIQKDNLYGLVNASGNIIINPEYTQITALTDDYNNGYIVKNSDEKFGIIGTDKTQILDCKYSDVKHVCGDKAYIVNDGTWKIVKDNTDEGIEIQKSDVKSINNDSIVVVSDEKYGIIGTDNSEKVAAEYQEIQHAFGDNYIAKKDDLYGIINSKNENPLAFEYKTLSYDKQADALVGTKQDDDKLYFIDRNFENKLTCASYTVSNGYIRARIDDDYKFYNLKFEEKSNKDVYTNHTLFVTKNDGKYGLVNRDGNLVISCQYEDILEQNEYGFVVVKKDGKWGVIDQYGNDALECKLDISDISKINFIGKWHSIEDVNAVYYINE